MVEQRLAVSAGAWYDGTALDTTRFGVLRDAGAGRLARRLEAALDAVIAEVIEKGVTADELERAKTRLIAETIYAQDNQMHAGAHVRRGARPSA